MLFFPVELAIALTGVVHFFNNIFKLFLVGRKADKEVVLRFGIPAIIAAIFGSWILLHMIELAPLFSYDAFGKHFTVYPGKFIISILLIIFAIIDLVPYFKTLKFGKEKLPVGGFLSGFFGGLTGNQGALRTAFLIKAGLSKDAFIATGVVVSTFVDFTRLGIYATRFMKSGLSSNLILVICVTLSGIAGTYLGNKMLKKVTLRFLQGTIAVMLILISIALGAGII